MYSPSSSRYYFHTWENQLQSNLILYPQTFPCFIVLPAQHRGAKKKNTKRASTRGAFVDVPADALPAIIPGSFTPPPFLALVSLLRSALLCTKPSSTPNLSQLVGEEFGIIVPSSVSVAAVPGERHAPRPALFREQRIFHRYFAGSNLGIFLTLAQEWIISNYLRLDLSVHFCTGRRQISFFFFHLGK